VRDCKVKWGVSCQRWGRHYDHGLIRGILKARITVSKAPPVRDFSQLKQNPDIRSKFDEAVSENLAKADPAPENAVESLANLQQAITAASCSTVPIKKVVPIRKRNVSTRTRELYKSREINFATMDKQQR
jgi:hypothetical protein